MENYDTWQLLLHTDKRKNDHYYNLFCWNNDVKMHKEIIILHDLSCKRINT